MWERLDGKEMVEWQREAEEASEFVIGVWNWLDADGERLEMVGDL